MTAQTSKILPTQSAKRRRNKACIQSRTLEEKKESSHRKKQTAKPRRKYDKGRFEIKPTKISVEKLTQKLTECVDKGIEFANKVLTDDTMVKITKVHPAHGFYELNLPKYSPEVKIEILKILSNKVFADKKEEYDLRDTPIVVGFEYSVIKK